MSEEKSIDEQTPVRPSNRSGIPVLAGIGSLAALVIGGQIFAGWAPPARPPAPAQVAVSEVPPPPAMHAQRFLNPAPPPIEAAQPPLQPETPETVPTPTPGAAPRSGMGRLAPLNGPLSAALPEGPVLGPNWNLQPLPSVEETGIIPGRGRRGRKGFGPAAALPQQGESEMSSEIPDAKKVELSRLASPDIQQRTVDDKKTPSVSAQQPLRLSVSAGRGRRIEVGDMVAVRVAASADCYLALICVDAAGTPSVLFRSSAPSRQLARVVRAGPTPGAEYLLAVGSVHPLESGDVGAAVRAAGGGFRAVPAAAEGVGPGSAWTAAVASASGLGSGSRWERFEYAVATASFAARAPAVTARRGGVRQDRTTVPVPPTSAPAGNTPAPTEGSQVPTAAPTTPKPETPAAKPEVKPDPTKPTAPGGETGK